MRFLTRLAIPAAFGLAVAGCSAPVASVPPAATTSAAAANAADITFAQMMIPHHQQAVTISDLILAKPGLAVEVTSLATAIKGAQQPEIEQMRGWLKSWGAPEGGDHGGHGSMNGMLTQAQLDAIAQADGVAAEKLFLSGMIAHHEGAISMAKQAETAGSNPDVKKLAAAIISSQQAEIDQMMTLLAARP